jgi:YidC/Oxa1 family membrane protein insertase
MPIMLMVWFNNYASGLSFYYLLSNIITMGQMVGMRYAVNDEKLHAKLKENAAKRKAAPKKKSKWAQRYEDMVKEQQRIQRQQQSQGKKK